MLHFSEQWGDPCRVIPMLDMDSGYDEDIDVYGYNDTLLSLLKMFWVVVLLLPQFEIKLALCKRTTQIAFLTRYLFLGQNKSCEYLCTQSCFVVYHSLQRASPQVLLVVSSLTSTSSSGGPSQQPGTGQLVSWFSSGLLVLLVLAVSNSLFCLPLRDVMLGQWPLFVIIWIFTRIRVVY